MLTLLIACGMISTMWLAFLVVEIVFIIQRHQFNEDLLLVCIMNLPSIVFFFWANADSEVRKRLEDLIP